MMMEGSDHQLPLTVSVASAVSSPLPPPPSAKRKDDTADTSILFGRGRYKFWAFAAILLLAFWSMFTGTLTLKWSAGNLTHDVLDSPPHDSDLDVLELEEREKVVRRMWDVYANSRTAQLPRFWQEAFEAAYEDLASDDATARDAAVAEIARMSMMLLADFDPLKSQLPNNAGENKGTGRTSTLNSFK